MLKFIHAADVHLDSPLLGLGALDAATRQRLRGVTREAFSALVSRALELRVDFVVLAGDLYDGSWKDVGTGLYFNQQVARLTAEKIPVVILHGNHDAASELRSMASRDLVHTFPSRRPATIRLEHVNVALHGQSFPEPAVVENLAEAYPEPERGALNVGVLHTALEGNADHARYAPCSLAQLKAKGYDYWALGHVHEHAVLSRDPWIVFPGNLQGRKINEPGAKGAMLVTVDGSRWNAERLYVDVLRWQTLAVDVSSCSARDDVVPQVRAHLAAYLERAEADDRPVAVRVRLEGATAAHGALWGEETRLRDDLLLVASEFGEGRVYLEKIRNETVPPAAASRRADAADALGDLQQYFDRAAQDPEFARLIRDDLEKFVGACPSEVREQVAAVKAWQQDRIADLVGDAAPALLARLHEVK
jgi:DNA repair exonuclease SbcCD nuclease subunit